MIRNIYILLLLSLSFGTVTDAIEHCVDDDTQALWHMNGIADFDEGKLADETGVNNLTEFNSPTSVIGFDGVTNGAYNFNAINITLGLPFIRISPDHGPNNIMIGQKRSDPSSLREALIFLRKINGN